MPVKAGIQKSFRAPDKMTKTSTTQRKGAKTQRNPDAGSQTNSFSRCPLRLGAFALSFVFVRGF
jgi:hypothetical protein